MKTIEMVNLRQQYQNMKSEIDQAILACLEAGSFIGGKPVERFQQALASYLQVQHVIPCANGTDALQLAMMALGLKPGDEVIVPTFTYVATAEVIGLLGLTPVMVDVELDSFNVAAEHILPALSPKTKAIVPVHLFGQTANMQGILDLAQAHNLYVIEDNAQAIGAVYTNPQGQQLMAGTIGHIGCTSFYPSKNLGAYGDGGAMFTQDAELAERLRTIANHGQRKRYYHDLIGVNSRLDAIQAAILTVKLQYLDQYIAARQRAADYYDQALAGLDKVQTPQRMPYTSHVFHQYTLRVPPQDRQGLQDFLQSRGIPTMIYYPLPLYDQPAFQGIVRKGNAAFPHTEALCASVLSLPMHTELDEEQLAHIVKAIFDYFN